MITGPKKMGSCVREHVHERDEKGHFRGARTVYWQWKGGRRRYSSDPFPPNNSQRRRNKLPG